jgi:hypothetical protein
MYAIVQEYTRVFRGYGQTLAQPLWSDRAWTVLGISVFRTKDEAEIQRLALERLGEPCEVWPIEKV